MDIVDGELVRYDIEKNAMGGTELFATNLVKYVEPELLKDVQIINSRVRGLIPNKKHILVLHDLIKDPENEHLRNGGYNAFDKLVFVSHWQMNQFIEEYGIPWYKCVVIENAIEPITTIEKPSDKIRLIYHTTPHRGLELLVPVFEQLMLEHNDIELDVYSSFKIYGWEKERDSLYEPLYKRCRDNAKINYHESVGHDEVLKAVASSHIFIYPSIWLETSCMCLMEAMSARCGCIHPNYGALFETSGGLTMQYQWDSDKREHMNKLYSCANIMINAIRNKQANFDFQKYYADNRYSWESRKHQWNNFLYYVKEGCK